MIIQLIEEEPFAKFGNTGQEGNWAIVTSLRFAAFALVNRHNFSQFPVSRELACGKGEVK